MIIWLLIGYMWLFVHRPFEIWPVLATIRLERVYMLFTVGCWLASGPSFPRRNRLHWSFALFVLMMLCSWLTSPYQEAGQATVEDYLKYVVFYVLLITSVHDERGLNTILLGYFGVMTLLMVHALREYFCGNVVYAQGVMRMTSVGSTFSDPNDFAGLIVCSIPFTWVLWHRWTDWRRGALLVSHLGLACYCIVLTASRMGMIGLALAAALAALASPKRWRALALLSIFLVAGWALLPEKHKLRYLTIIDPSYGPPEAAASAGNLRYSGFEAALPLFAQRPLLGFGPNSFREASGRITMPHNLYGQLLAEFGAAGAVALAWIVLGVAQNTLDARRIARGPTAPDDLLPWRTVVAMSASYLLLLAMGWGFNFLLWHVWLWFGGFQAVALCCLEENARSVQSASAPEPNVTLDVRETPGT